MIFHPYSFHVPPTLQARAIHFTLHSIIFHVYSPNIPPTFHQYSIHVQIISTHIPSYSTRNLYKIYVRWFGAAEVFLSAGHPKRQSRTNLTPCAVQTAIAGPTYRHWNCQRAVPRSTWFRRSHKNVVPGPTWPRWVVQTAVPRPIERSMQLK